MLTAYLTHIIVGFAGVQGITALVNLIFRPKFFDAIENTELISVLIPARNEEKNISNILNDLQKQDYHNIEIIVFNDDSEDQTSSIVRQFTNAHHPAKLIASEELPKGWTGKNYACNTLARYAQGKYLLFLDADVRIGTKAIGKTLNFLKRHKLGLMSVFPTQIMKTPGERMTVPLMNYILVTLLPLILVRTSNFVALSAANGQYMLFDAEIYKKYLPHQAVKNSQVEDIRISRYLKQNRIKVACTLAEENIQCRMYRGYYEAVNGFSKNVFMFFGNSVWLSVAFWVMVFIGQILVIFSASFPLMAIYFSLVITTRIIVSVLSSQNIIHNILYCIPQHIALANIIYIALHKKSKKVHQWKGRNFS